MPYDIAEWSAICPEGWNLPGVDVFDLTERPILAYALRSWAPRDTVVGLIYNCCE